MRTKVLFIVGVGRSGSTLLDNILGQVDGFFSLGELLYIWDRCLRDNRSCACGELFDCCPAWIPVIERLGDRDPSALDRLIASRDRLGPLRAVLRSFLGHRRLVDPELDRLLTEHGRLYRAVQESTRCRVLVDSSKFPVLGYLIQQLPEIEPYFVHLIRDPRAVAAAWRKTKICDASGPQPLYMSRFSISTSGKMWTKWNLAAEILCRPSRARYRKLFYEDFVRRPRESIESLLEWIGEGSEELPFEGETEVRLAKHHSVGGNPSRFESGAVEIRADEGWRQTMSWGQQLTVLALTWPLFLRYGYPRRRS